MDKLQNHYLRQTFGKIIQEDAVLCFERKLLELSPHFSEIAGIGKLLLGTLAVLIQHLDDLESVKKTTQIFISRYNLRTEDLQNMRQAFCWTLDQHLELHLNLPVKTAWLTFFEVLLTQIPSTSN